MVMPPSNSGRLTEAGASSAQTADGEHLVQDAVVLDMPPFNRFSIISPSEPSRPISTPTSSDRPALSSSDSGGDSSDDDSGQERENGDTFDANHSPTIPRMRPVMPGPSTQSHPRFSRAFSLPLPSQLGHLKHPHRSSLSSLMKPAYSEPVSPQQDPFKELSLELADSVQAVIQTMLQISPAQVLDSAKEQFSACALSVPTPSMSAMFSAMKNLNYIAANMAAFTAEEKHPEKAPLFSKKNDDFDIGELLQNTGDALSASAAQIGVDLVLFHGDVALRHVWVKGDESGMRYLLSLLITQILTSCQRGDTIELGLFVNRSPSTRRQNSASSESLEEDPLRSAALHLEGEGPFHCVIEIFHKFSSSSTSEGIPRPQLSLSSLNLRRLLTIVGATLSEYKPTFDGPLEVGRSCRLSLALDGGISPQQTPATVTEDNSVSASEPTLEQLSTFVDSLKGKKVHLYASSKGSFAHHLTSYLTAWGMDVSHISSEGGMESVPEPPSSPSTTPNIEAYTPSGIPQKMELPRQPKPQPASFIFIDDDVNVLKERVQAIKDGQAYPLHLNSRKRPALAAHHRPRSSPQVARISAGVNVTPVVILHFTSLANFKVTKDAVQSVLNSYRGTLLSLPEIMVIPKPAGPRRFLTLLHTAVTKPVVDPFFSPIATTPSSPYATGSGSFLSQRPHSGSPRTPSVHRPSGSRSNSDRSSRSVNNVLENHVNLPPSPLSMQESSEYFSETVAKFGETQVKLGDTARSGVILQSPDGQPTGIFFSPRAEKTNMFSSYGMERDRGHLSIVGPRRSLSSIEGPQVTFSSLHQSSGDSARRPSGAEVNVQIPSRQNSRSSISPHTDTSEAPHVEPQISRKASNDLNPRKGILPVSPPGSPPADSTGSPLRNPRRSKLDGKGLSPIVTGKKGKSPAENIVPPISVLIVDDNPINRTILSTFMKRNKIRYDVASNGKEAVEKWKTGEFHLILMDIQMPVMDGIDATRTIRNVERVNSGYIQPSPSIEFEDRSSSARSDDSNSRPSAVSPYRSSVIIVALTASSLQSDRIAALAAGCNDFLTKPVSLQWLNNKLIEWGSIKALSMYADMAPEVVRTQTDQAKNIAERLHVPKGRKTPPSPPAPKSPAVQPATHTPSPPSALAQSLSPRSGTSSAMWSPAQPSAAMSFRAHLGLKSPAHSQSLGSHDSENIPLESTPTPARPPSVAVDPSSPVQSQFSETLNGFISNRPKFDPNASTSTLKQVDIFRSKSDEVASSENVRESGSTSSVSRSPSPTTPATPGSPLLPASIRDDEKSRMADVEDPTDLRLELNVPGGCMELYNQAGNVREDPVLVPP
ncbi:hypothetical protein GGU10DRAFT_388942 [Lentinula aff. detonsa]|uniref:Response regulatory domain-containing protein n=1 Tax=Lentinula aff. detonsa TaxID=2804958 RepID=A0AA38KNS6_9AGAR|nr:hypothetical protein GGU10DRAFT_388942 [Lentinula aff. detonsa]